jgi:hypothetical protein
MPWRVIFPSSSSAWKALESCSRCVPCTQLDMIRGPKVCLWYKRLCLVHCLCRYPCPNCLRCPPPFGVAAFLLSFLNLQVCLYPSTAYFLRDRPSVTPSKVTSGIWTRITVKTMHPARPDTAWADLRSACHVKHGTHLERSNSVHALLEDGVKTLQGCMALCSSICLSNACIGIQPHGHASPVLTGESVITCFC